MQANEIKLGDTVLFGETPGIVDALKDEQALVSLLYEKAARWIPVEKLQPSAAKLKRVYGKQAGGTLQWAR